MVQDREIVAMED